MTQRASCMNRRAFLRGVAAAGVTACAGPRAAQGARRRKFNVILFLVDDLGWVDTTVYGSRYYNTPNVERLARRGMRFTNAYAANPLCSPTRASILTGKYPARLHLTAPAGHLPKLDTPLLPKKAPSYARTLVPRSKRYLPLEERTLAERLRAEGYRTGFIGKWHLGHDEQYWPLHQGFDVNVGGGRWPGPPSYFSPYKISELPDGPEGECITDRLTDEALAYIEAQGGAPFFLCFWHYAVHAPYQSKEDYRRAYLDTTDPRNAQNNPVMAGMIQSMDESLGRLLDALDAQGLAEDTILVFCSDNGGNMYDRTHADGAMLPAQSAEGLRPTNNAPLRSGKGSIYEGGVRVPLFVVWPGHVAPGSVSDEVACTIDFYPTLLDLLGLEPAADKILDGESLAPVLMGTGRLAREALFCHYPHEMPAVPCRPCTSARRGRWKLIRFYEQDAAFPNAFELYDLERDVGELHNVAAQHPELVRELDALIDTHLDEVGAIVPPPNPDYDPEALIEVDGWRANFACALAKTNGALRVKSRDADPFITTGRVEAVTGPLTLTFRYRSESAGQGQFFWLTDRRPRFVVPHPLRMTYDPGHDGAWHEQAFTFEAETPLRLLRLDPSSAPGPIDIAWITLENAQGERIQAWDFTAFKDSEK